MAKSSEVLKPSHVAFMSRPLLGKFASVSKDGSPHVTPVWFMYEDGKLIVTTPATTVKARNVAREPRVALLIDDGETYLMVRGRAIITKRDSKRDLERLAARYEGPDASKSLPELLKEAQVTIEITPERVVSQNL